MQEPVRKKPSLFEGRELTQRETKIAFALIALSVAAILIWFVVSGRATGKHYHDGPGSETEMRRKQSGVDKARARELKAKLDQSVARGEITSIDYQRRIMRMDPVLWSAMSLQLKQDITAAFYGYYAAEGSEIGGVEVRSSQNDTVFAECSITGGMKILR
jgi:hypothetical protein